MKKGSKNRRGDAEEERLLPDKVVGKFHLSEEEHTIGI